MLVSSRSQSAVRGFERDSIWVGRDFCGKASCREGVRQRLLVCQRLARSVYGDGGDGCIVREEFDLRRGFNVFEVVDTNTHNTLGRGIDLDTQYGTCDFSDDAVSVNHH